MAMCEVYRRGFAGIPVDRWSLSRRRRQDRDNARPQFTDHYFTGDYPTRLLDKDGETVSASSPSWPATAEAVSSPFEDREGHYALRFMR
jgi:hypothetical protein